MNFRILDLHEAALKDVLPGYYLIRNSWDDWFEYDTQFNLLIVDEQSNKHWPGKVKIGQKGLRGSHTLDPSQPLLRSPNLATTFPQLEDEFFSLGQDDNYYETLNKLGWKIRESILRALRDCAFDADIYEQYKNEPVMIRSLLRYVTAENLENRFRRLSRGNAVLTRFHFEFDLPQPFGMEPTTLDFKVEPRSQPSTNIHVLIGRNGVGKSHCLRSLTNTVLGVSSDDRPHGVLRRAGMNKDEWSFSGLVHVCFSAFDTLELPPKEDQAIPGTLVGLPTEGASSADGTGQLIKLSTMLAEQFVESLSVCRTGLRRERLERALEALSTDPLLAEARIERLLELAEDEWRKLAEGFFRKLSSGHAIVLLTTIRLVELVDERTLVVLDEPEGHLHPPLLSAFVRAVSSLLAERNGVAIIATHSPVVLQEVPQSCVWKLYRSGMVSAAERPEIETFGENVGLLTREVFGLEVQKSGFHALISDAVKSGMTYQEVLSHFDGQLGAEGQAIARHLVATRNREGGLVS